jgi:hypothetical protein
MPTVADYLRSPPTLATLRDRWIIVPADLAANLRSYQPADAPHRVEPTELTDGTFAVCADVLTERAGIFADLWAALDQTAAARLEILKTSDVPWPSP